MLFMEVVNINDFPAGLEPPTGARKKRKGTMKIRQTRYFIFFPCSHVFFYKIFTQVSLKIEKILKVDLGLTINAQKHEQ